METIARPRPLVARAQLRAPYARMAVEVVSDDDPPIDPLAWVDLIEAAKQLVEPVLQVLGFLRTRCLNA